MAAAAACRGSLAFRAMAVVHSPARASFSPLVGEPTCAGVPTPVSAPTSCAVLGSCAERLQSSLSRPSLSSSSPGSDLAIMRCRSPAGLRGIMGKRANVRRSRLTKRGGGVGRSGGEGGGLAERRGKRIVRFIVPVAELDTIETTTNAGPTTNPNDRSGPVELSGPIELEFDPFAVPKATSLQTVASYILTGTIAALLFRSLRRRSKNAKKMRFRSDGTTEVGKETTDGAATTAALDSGSLASQSPTTKPTVLSTFTGALVAGAIAFVLYKFTVTVEGSFAKQLVSSNYSVRNLTITVRTIINGLCYLATFVFAANSIGLGLFALQLLLEMNPQDAEGSKKEGESLQGNSMESRNNQLQNTNSAGEKTSANNDDDQRSPPEKPSS